MGISATNYINGPFMLVATDPDKPEDTIVVAPNGGFKSKEDATEYAEQFKEGNDLDNRPYFGLEFFVAPLLSQEAFNRYMSW